MNMVVAGNVLLTIHTAVLASSENFGSVITFRLSVILRNFNVFGFVSGIMISRQNVCVRVFASARHTRTHILAHTHTQQVP